MEHHWQDVAAMSGVFIALCALVFSLWQAAESRKHNRLSFRPHLTTWTERHPEKGQFELELVNNGLGPAIIKTSTFLLDGVPLGGNSITAFQAELNKLFPRNSFELGVGDLENGAAMSPNQRITMLNLRFLKAPYASGDVVEQFLERSDLEIIYRSFYGEEFKLSTKTEPTIKPLRLVVMEHGPFD